jgi:hypothetical protein
LEHIMSSLIESKNAMQGLGVKAQTIMDDPRMTNAVKMRKLGELEVELKGHMDVVNTHAKARRLMSGGDSIDYNPYTPAGMFGAKSVGAPSIMPSEDQMRELHDAVLSHRSLKINIETKTPGADIPAQLMPGIVGFRHEPTRILEMLPTPGMEVPVVEYIRHLSTTGLAGVTAAGATKPAVTLVTDKVLAPARKIAVTTLVNDEDLADFGAFNGYVTSELTRLIIDAENLEMLSGDGTGEHLLGLLIQSGILTRVQAVSPATALDTIQQAFTDLRVGPALTAPSLLVLHPTTWSMLQRSKDTQGRYLVQPDPTQATANTLWNIPVLQTTQIAVGTGLAMNTELAAAAHIRQGITLQTDYGQTGFEKNQTAFRCEERLALAVPRPSAIIKITALA